MKKFFCSVVQHLRDSVIQNASSQRSYLTATCRDTLEKYSSYFFDETHLKVLNPTTCLLVFKDWLENTRRTVAYTVIIWFKCWSCVAWFLMSTVSNNDWLVILHDMLRYGTKSCKGICQTYTNGTFQCYFGSYSGMNCGLHDSKVA